MRHICFIADRHLMAGHSAAGHPSVPDSVLHLARQLAAQGHRCTVVCPVSSGLKRPSHASASLPQMERSGKGTVECLFPLYTGFGQQLPRLPSIARLALIVFTEAVSQAVRGLDTCPDLFLGHQVFPAGIASARMGRMFCRPAFLSCAESQPWSSISLEQAFMGRELSSLAGVITTSTFEKATLAECAIVPRERIGVFPDGIDLEHFFPRGRAEARQRFRIPADLFIAAYAGPFTEHHGIRKAIQAIAQTHGVYGIYSGSGPIRPSGPKTLFCGQVLPSEMPWFFSAADVLLLPAHSASGNVIAEALACGLPAIASRNAFNDDLLDDDCSIRVDADNLAELQSALVRISRNGDLRREQTACAWVHGRRLSVNARARKIAAFLDARSESWLHGHLAGPACAGRPARDMQG